MTDYFKQKCPLFSTDMIPGYYLKLNTAGTALETGVIPSTASASYIGKIAADPDTTGWGAAEEGTVWFNGADKKFKGWNGSEIILLG